MPPDLVVFLDENHHNNKKLLEVLHQGGVSVERYGAHFPPQRPDTEWMECIAGRNWAVLTTDKRIRYRALERAAVKRHHLGMFCFTSNNGAAKLAAALENAIPAMRVIHNEEARPFIATISESGMVVVRDRFGR